MELHASAGQLPDVSEEFFSRDVLAPLFSDEFMQVVCGGDWNGVLIEDNGRALLHWFSASEIGDTGSFDIEPLVGYAGMVTSTTDREFLTRAISSWSEYCRSRKIVAELIRFNPWVRNADPLRDIHQGLRIVDGKPIVCLPVHADEKTLLASYSRRCRNRVRAGLDRFDARPLGASDSDWSRFVDLYHSSMTSLGASAEWHFDPEFFRRLRACPDSTVFGAWHGDTLASAASFLVMGDTVHYFVGGNAYSPDLPDGANNAMIHAAARHFASRGFRQICLGGGRTDSPDDSLLRFKAGFSETTPALPLGFFVHDERVYRAFDSIAAYESAEARESNLFLRYRLAPSFKNGRMRARKLLGVAG